MFSDSCAMNPQATPPARPHAVSPPRRGRTARLASAALLAAAPFPASAAQQGELAAQSRGTLSITVSVAARTAVSGIADASLAPRAGSGTASALQRVCIRTNSATGRYDLVASGAAANGPGGGRAGFVLSAADGATVPLALTWTDAAAGARPLLPDAPLRGLVASPTACSATTASMFAIAAPAGHQPSAGAITLTFSPL